MKLKTLIKCIIALMFLPYVYAETASINVITDEWSLYADKDGSGYYFDVLRAVYEPLGIKLNYKHVPYIRAVAILNAHEADVILGTYRGWFDENLYSEKPVEIDRVDAAISKKLEAIWQGPESLKGQRSAAILGQSFAVYYELGESYFEVKNVDSLVKMLAMGRVDAIIDYERNIQSELKTIGAEGRYTIKKGVFWPPIYFVFSNTEKGQHLKRLFDEGIKTLRQTGELRALLIKNIGDDSRYAE